MIIFFRIIVDEYKKMCYNISTINERGAIYGL